MFPIGVNLLVCIVSISIGFTLRHYVGKKENDYF